MGLSNKCRLPLRALSLRSSLLNHIAYAWHRHASERTWCAKNALLPMEKNRKNWMILPDYTVRAGYVRMAGLMVQHHLQQWMLPRCHPALQQP